MNPTKKVYVKEVAKGHAIFAAQSTNKRHPIRMGRDRGCSRRDQRKEKAEISFPSSAAPMYDPDCSGTPPWVSGETIATFSAPSSTAPIEVRSTCSTRGIDSSATGSCARVSSPRELPERLVSIEAPTNGRLTGLIPQIHLVNSPVASATL
jgi:hypothetical protein